MQVCSALSLFVDRLNTFCDMFKTWDTIFQPLSNVLIQVPFPGLCEALFATLLQTLPLPLASRYLLTCLINTSRWDTTASGLVLGRCQHLCSRKKAAAVLNQPLSLERSVSLRWKDGYWMSQFSLVLLCNQLMSVIPNLGQDIFSVESRWMNGCSQQPGHKQLWNIIIFTCYVSPIESSSTSVKLITELF